MDVLVIFVIYLGRVVMLSLRSVCELFIVYV